MGNWGNWNTTTYNSNNGINGSTAFVRNDSFSPSGRQFWFYDVVNDVGGLGNAFYLCGHSPAALSCLPPILISNILTKDG